MDGVRPGQGNKQETIYWIILQNYIIKNVRGACAMRVVLECDNPTHNKQKGNRQGPEKKSEPKQRKQQEQEHNTEIKRRM